MLKKMLLLAAMAMLSLATVFAQEADPKFDFRLGVGTSFLGSGDMLSLMIENEVNYSVSSRFTLGGSLAFGQSGRGAWEQQTSFYQFNGNVYYSFFKNVPDSELRVGVGLSWNSVTDMWLSSVTTVNGEVVDKRYSYENRKSIGRNLIIEYTHDLSEKVLIGTKAFLQSYRNFDQGIGVMARVGLRI